MEAEKRDKQLGCQADHLNHGLKLSFLVEKKKSFLNVYLSCTAGEINEFVNSKALPVDT